MKKIQLLSALFLVTLFTACNPDDNPAGSNQNDDTFAENFGSAVARDFIGQVVNTDNQPVQNATITIGTSTVQTDANGVFIINNASVHTKFAYIKASKTGYIEGSRAMVPTSGKNNVKIMLIPGTPLQSVQSGVASEVSLPSGTKVKFDGAFQDEDGNAYIGSVNVAMFHLTSSDENLSSLMPGMLYAQTQNNQEAILETFGMLNVELRGSAGQKLNIKEGHTAEITMKIDDSQLAAAPGSIPLWHFDEQKGYWKEDGVASKSGNKYIGKVSHFSWWNVDVQFPTVSLTITVVDTNGNSLPNMAVGLVADNENTYPVMGYTDSLGHISGLVPSDQTLVLQVYANFYTCAATNTNVLYTSSIGPFTADSTLPNIVINSSSILSSNVVGNLVKCDNTNVTNGYVMLKRERNTSFVPITNGIFSFNEFYCAANTQFRLEGVDFDNLQETGSINYNFTAPITNIGNLHTCNSISEFVSFRIDNEPLIFHTDIDVRGDTNGFRILAGSVNGTVINNTISISSNTKIPGIYSTSAFTLNIIPNVNIHSAIQNTIQFNLNEYGAVRGYVDMTINGNYTDSFNITHTVTGTVHARIDY